MNDENTLIIADDVTGENKTNPPAASPDQSWLGGRQNVFAENFLEKHKAEFEDFERQEREKLACAERFRALEAKIISRRQWLENLRADIAAYETVDLATDIFKNMEMTGRTLLDITQNPLFSAAALIKQHGKKIMHLAEQEVAGLENQFNNFKSEKRQALKEAGLI